ncbi:MAG: hypothetical protein ACFB6S_17505 [Geminicoccaceae bacterium]
MGETLNIRDVNPVTKAALSAAAERAGMSLAAYVRLKLDEIAGTPRRKAGALEKLMKDVGEPVDGWGPMSEDELTAWEGRDDRGDPGRDDRE